MNSKQIYSIPTYDAAFKWILSEETLLPSFFHAFVSNLEIERATRLDDHMNPLQVFQLLRNFIYSNETEQTVASLKNVINLAVHVTDQDSITRHSPEASVMLQDFLHHFPDIQQAFPQPRFNGTMDFVCELNSGEFVIVEMQVAAQDYWDCRALAYIAAFFGNQLRKGDDWTKLKKVIGINILGGGKDNINHWSDTPDQYMRHYKMQEQLHKDTHKRFIDGVELIQYSLANAPTHFESQEQRDWVTFFKCAHLMTEEEVRNTIKTPAVLRAFERAKLENLPSEVRQEYNKEEANYDKYSMYTENIHRQGVEQGLAQGLAQGIELATKNMIKNMLAKNIPTTLISEITRVSMEDIQSIQQEIVVSIRDEY